MKITKRTSKGSALTFAELDENFQYLIDNKANSDLSNVSNIPPALLAQLKGDAGPVGPQGVAGPQGPKGDPGGASIETPSLSVSGCANTGNLTQFSLTTVQFNAIEQDTIGAYNASASDVALNGLTVPAWSYKPNKKGWYLVFAKVGLSGSSVGQELRVIGANSLSSFANAMWSDGNYGGISPTIAVPIYLNGITDYVQIKVAQYTAGTCQISSSSSLLRIKYLGE